MTQIIVNAYSYTLTDPPQITTIPADGIVEVLLGGQVQMGCMASGWPTPVVTWKFKVSSLNFSCSSNVDQLSSQDEVMKATDNRHKLIFIANDIQQSGVYVCEADNKIGRPAASSVVVKILCKYRLKNDANLRSMPGSSTYIYYTRRGIIKNPHYANTILIYLSRKGRSLYYLMHRQSLRYKTSCAQMQQISPKCLSFIDSQAKTINFP